MKTIIFALSMFVTTCLLTSCTTNEEEGLKNLTEEQANFLSELEKIDVLSDTTSLTQDEANGLILMREEEKMAHDVYADFYQKYKLNVFSNITSSEARHTDAILYLIDAYDLIDPATTELGVFKNPAIQNLYNKFIADGVDSTMALKIGAFIEEYDIADLKKLISETNNAYIIKVYTNLLNGSKNHLKAFVSNLATKGITYEPQILTATEFAEYTKTSRRGRN